MTQLPYDPAGGKSFWAAIQKIPAFPAQETMPIQEMIFESGALFKTTAILKAIGARQEAPLVVVMDETPMRRAGQDLKALMLNVLRNEGWQAQVVFMRADESGQVHTDLPHIRQVQASLVPGCSVLSVGSGVVTDTAKHGCFLYQQETGAPVPFAVFQTANSVSAFTSKSWKIGAPTAKNLQLRSAIGPRCAQSFRARRVPRLSSGGFWRRCMPRCAGLSSNRPLPKNRPVLLS